MTPAKLNLPTIYRGLIYSHRFIWRNPDKSLINNTGYLAKLQLKNDAVTVNFTQGNGIVLGGSSGTIDIELSAAQCSALTANTYNFALILTDSANHDFYLARGMVGVSDV